MLHHRFSPTSEGENLIVPLGRCTLNLVFSYIRKQGNTNSLTWNFLISA